MNMACVVWLWTSRVWLIHSEKSAMFADASTKLKREMWWRKVKTQAAIGLGVFVSAL